MSIFDLFPDDKSERPLMFGVTVAVVTNNKDPDKLGRVKCRFIAREKEEETDWIRVASFMAGKDRGGFFLPEVDDEVLIAFAGGDISKPYVIGSLWNSKDTAPQKNEDGKNNIREIKSRSGSEFVFNDTQGKEKVIIHTPKEMEVILDDEKETMEIHDKGSKNSIKIESKSGQITLKAEKKIVLEAGNCKIEMDGNSNSIKISSGTSIKVNSQQINIESGGTFAAKANGMLDIKSSAIVKINGSMVKIN
ncbi:MAG: phage baseplate assembly protein V [Acetivibrionales bacterium]|jgi:uncharacterized protein involved in type VI secretion and phage assembly